MFFRGGRGETKGKMERDQGGGKRDEGGRCLVGRRRREEVPLFVFRRPGTVSCGQNGLEDTRGQDLPTAETC